MLDEIRDVAPGLWIWRVRYPDWRPRGGMAGDRQLDLRGVARRGRRARRARAARRRGGALGPSRRASSDRRRRPQAGPRPRRRHFVRRYGARAFGPYSSGAANIPETELEPIEPGTELPGGLVALYDGRGRNETPLWLPEQRALVFADALTAPDRELRVWGTPWHEERVLPALRELLELPFEHVIVSHGEPVHDRAAFERALELEPYEG